jgi:flagellar biosynthesis/type III secretory pathway protein FliH
MTGGAGFPRMRFHRSPDISRGGCIVKTRFGIIDARREVKLAELEKTVLA